jgi:hypothetical protein
MAISENGHERFDSLAAGLAYNIADEQHAHAAQPKRGVL